MRKLRIFALAAVSIALVGVVGWTAVGAIGGEPEPGEELCDALTTDLDAAVGGGPKLPDVSDVEPMRLGLCSTKKTRRYDVRLPGGVDHREASTIAGRITLDLDRPRGLARLRSAYRSETVVALPRLGPGAFLVITVKPDRHEPADGGVYPVGFPNDVTGGVPLPATAYWKHGDAIFSASGTRAGASVDESQRITARLAELLDRRPVRAPYT